MGGIGTQGLVTIFLTTVVGLPSDWTICLGPLHISELFLLLLSSLVLLLLLVLLVGRLRQVHLHLDLWAIGGTDVAPKNLVREQGLVEDFIVWSGTHEILVIDIRVLGWIYSDEVTATLVLIACLSYVLLKAKLRTLLHWIHKERIILWIVNCKLLNHLM